jgi:hypothetical protein
LTSGDSFVIDRQRGNPALAHQVAQEMVPARDAALHKSAAMGIDEQGRAIDVVRQIKPARHLAMRTGQGEVALALQGHRAFAEKAADAIGRGADLGKRCLGAVGCNQTLLLQQSSGGNQLRIDPRRGVVHRVFSSRCAVPDLWLSASPTQACVMS